MRIQAVAWNDKSIRALSGEKSDIMYTLQVASSDKRIINKVIKETSDWQQAGEGYDSNNRNLIILLKKSFKDKSEWIRFANTLSFDVEEISRTGKKIIINGKRKRP